MEDRGQHFFDTRKAGGIVTRTLRNWCSFRRPGRPWEPTSPRVVTPAGVPDDWTGRFPFRRQSLYAPLQTFFGDDSDPDNDAMVGCRLADSPDVWIDVKALDALPSRLVELPDNTVKWPGVWRKTTLFKQAAPSKLAGTLRLEERDHPDVVRYTVRMADGMRIEIKNNRAHILDAEGVERLHMPAPMGWDSSTVNPESPDGRRPIRVTMREGERRSIGGRWYQVIEIEPDRDDLEHATYPVSIGGNDTVQITGTTDIEDTYLSELLPSANYGLATTLYMRPPGIEQRPLIRISVGSIPAGTITGFRLFSWPVYCTTSTFYAYIVAGANTWSEAIASWNQCRNGFLDWAGHPVLGCHVSGTDFDADGSPPSLSFGPGYNQWYQFDLKPEWPPLWRDTVRAPNGMVLSLPHASQQYRLQSSEESVHPLYFEIDYEEAAVGIAQRFFMMGGGG